LRAPATSSLTWVLQRSFTKLPRLVFIVTVSAAGLPQASHTRIVFSAIPVPLPWMDAHKDRGNRKDPDSLEGQRR
jgi:hypothetical protein